MLDLALFRNRTFTGATAIVALLAGGPFGAFVYVTLFLLDVQERGPVEAGLVLAPLALVSFVVSAAAGRASERVPLRGALVAGMLITAAGMLALRAGMSEDATWLALLPGLAITGVGVGLANPLTTFAHLGVLPPAQGGLASALNNTARQIGLAIGIAVLGALLEAGAARRRRRARVRRRRRRAAADLRRAVAAGRAGRRRAGAPARPVGAARAVASAAVEVRTTDYHTAGEPFRIVLEGAPELPGATVAERRARALESPDAAAGAAAAVPRAARARGHVRRLPRRARRRRRRARRAVLAQGRLLDGVRPRHDRARRVGGRVGARRRRPTTARSSSRSTCPSGRVGARVRMEGGAVAAVAFRNVPAYVLARGVEVDTARGRLAVDVSYGGAIYASLPAAAAGLAVEPARLGELTALGREIKWALERRRGRAPPERRAALGHLRDDPLRRPRATGRTSATSRCSPTARSTARRAARAPRPAPRCSPPTAGCPTARCCAHESIVGTAFRARVVEHGAAPRAATPSSPRSRARAHRTGEHRFVLDPRDPLGEGFVLR